MPPNGSWQRVDLSAPEHAQPTEPPYVGGLLYRRKRHAISGPPEAAKTMTSCILGLEHARAGEGAFALVDFEIGAAATRLMLEDLGATPEEIGAVYYVEPDSPPDTEAIDSMLAAGVSLVIVDALAGAYDASGLDDGKRADVQKFARTWSDALWKRGLTVVLLDHVVKNADNRGKWAIGSERKLGVVDVHLGLTAVRQLHRGADGLIRITTLKDRGGHLERPTAAEVDLHSDPETHRITWTFRPAAATADGPETPWKPTALMEKVSRYLELQRDPVSRSQIGRDVTGKREYVLAAIDHLIADGHAAETDGPRRARLVVGLTSYRDQPAPVPDPFPTRSRERDDDQFPVPLPLGGNGNGSSADADDVTHSQERDDVDYSAREGEAEVPYEALYPDSDAEPTVTR